VLSADQLRQIMPAADINLWLPLTNKAMTDFVIDTPIRMATFLAHVAVESSEMRTLVENMNYSVGRLMGVWPHRFPTAEIAAPYAHNPERLGNYVYANRLGNGPSSSGDGFRFRGRGLLQATGKDHYSEAGKALNLDLLNHPELLEQPPFAAAEAAWWWRHLNLNSVADTANLKESTIKINGGLTGYSDRVVYWNRALDALGVSTPAAQSSNVFLKVQKALNARGAEPPLDEDGIWGPLSEAAADRFRAEAGLQERDGVDAALLQALGIV
jgi:putative chitinase